MLPFLFAGLIITAIIILGVYLWRKFHLKTKSLNNNIPQNVMFGIQNKFYLDTVPQLCGQSEACPNPTDSREHINSSQSSAAYEITTPLELPTHMNATPQNAMFGIQNRCYLDTVIELCEQNEACPNTVDHSGDHAKSSQSSAASSHRWHFEQSDSDAFSDPTTFQPDGHMPHLNDYPVVLPDFVSPYSASQISTAGIEVHCNIGIGITGYDNQDQKPYDLIRKSHRRSKRKQSRRWKRIGYMDLHHANQSGDSGIGLSSSLSGDAAPSREVMSQDVSSWSRCYHPVRRTSSMLSHNLHSTNTYPRRKRHGRSSVGQCDAHDIADSSNASSHIVPPCIRPTATLHRCTSMGRTYRDRLNGFKLRIPRGAIPEGESLTIDIGVALYGPFQYPEGLRPVSPVFWICVRNRKHHIRFQKPVHITLQHCLNVDSEEDTRLLELTFLKGDHEMNSDEKYQFHVAKDQSVFKANTDCGTLYTYHFCYQCIVCKTSEFTLQRAKFCLFGTIPDTFVYNKPMYIFFFVSFLLKTCLDTIRRQMMNMPEIADHVYHEAKKDFQFSTSPIPAIGIKIPKDLPGGWQLGLQFQNEVGSFSFSSMYRIILYFVCTM